MTMPWTSAFCAFAVEMFFKTCHFVIATQRDLSVNFMLNQNDIVLNTIFCSEQY